TRIQQAADRKLPTELVQNEERDRILMWLDEYRYLAERLAYGPTFLAQLHDFLLTLRDRLLTPWDRALNSSHLLIFRRRAAHLPLSRSERVAIRDREMTATLDKLGVTVQQSLTVHQQRARVFEAALERWRSWHAQRSWVEAFYRLEMDALQQQQQLVSACTAW